MVASAFSVAKLPYEHCQDGISLTHNLLPSSLDKSRVGQIENLEAALDGLFERGLFHINVNVLQRETLLDAMAAPRATPSTSSSWRESSNRR